MTMKFIVGDLVTRNDDKDRDYCIVTTVQKDFCSNCQADTGPLSYALYPYSRHGKHAWFRGEDLTFVSRHIELEL